MYITQHNVFDMLSGFPYRSLIHGDDLFRFQWASLLLPGELPDDPGYLYICDAGTLAALRCEEPERFCFLCVGEEAEIVDLAARQFNIIAIISEVPAVRILTRLQTAFSKLLRWSYQINSDIAKQTDFQTIVDRSRDIFGDNLLILVNSSYNILAASTTETGGSENLRQLLRRGYYSKETTDDLAKRGYFKYSYRYTSPALLDTPNFMECPVLVTSIYANQQFYGFTALYYTEGRRLTTGEYGLYKWFSHKLRDYYLRCIGTDGPIRSQKDAFISDLLLNFVGSLLSAALLLWDGRGGRGTGLPENLMPTPCRSGKDRK